jgi:hypothetical protein
MTFPDLDIVGNEIVDLIKPNVSIPVEIFPADLEGYVERRLKSAQGIILVGFSSFETIAASEAGGFMSEDDIDADAYRLFFGVIVTSRDKRGTSKSPLYLKQIVNSLQRKRLTIGTEPYNMKVVSGDFLDLEMEKALWSYSLSVQLEPNLYI